MRIFIRFYLRGNINLNTALCWFYFAFQKSRMGGAPTAMIILTMVGITSAELSLCDVELLIQE